MRKRIVLLGFVLGLLLAGVGGVLTSGAEGGGCTGIIVNDADATQCSSMAGDSLLDGLLDLVLARLYMGGADANAEIPLVVDGALVGLLGQVADRLYMGGADANGEFVLLPNGTLATLLGQVAERVYMGGADANGEFALSRPCDLLNDTLPPALIGGIMTSQMFGEVTVAWTTDEFATSLVEYGTALGNYTDVVSDSLLVTEHALVLAGLTDGETYYFRVQNADGCGNLFVSGEQSFTVALQPGVAVTKSASTDVAFSGEELTYTIVVSNTGDVLLNATVIDTLPPDVVPNGTLTWTPTIAPGATWSVSFDVTIDADFVGSLTNRVDVTTDEGVSDNAVNVVEVLDPVVACGATIVSLGSGSWDDPAVWSLGRVPSVGDVVLIRPGHSIIGSTSTTITSLCNYGTLSSQPFSDLYVTASGFISNTGSILGWDGSAGGPCGAAGGSLELRGSPISNEGVIRAGRGGDGVECGGHGGHALVFGRNTTNRGTICAGAGGDVSGTGAGVAGDGGDAHIWGKWGGSGFLLNTGLLCAGDGGDGNPSATQPQHGGCGGWLKLMASPVLLSGGVHRSGAPGQGTGGGADGCWGNITIDPDLIDLSGTGTEIIGGNITIFGGDDWTLDLSGMSGMAISATQRITLAVGSVNGVVDLQGNAEPVFSAGEELVIASDVILLDGGVVVDDLVMAPSVSVEPGRVLYNVSLTGPTYVEVTANESTAIPITLLNSGPMVDTYDLTVSDSAGWDLSGLPATMSVDGLDFVDLVLDVVPAGVSPNRITLTATSQNDPTQTAILHLDLAITDSQTTLYLPIINKPH